MRLFFVRKLRDTGFHLFCKNMYDSMRLCYLRIFNVAAPKVSRVELELNQAMLKTLTEERAALKKSEAETKIRRSQVAWKNSSLTGA